MLPNRLTLLALFVVEDSLHHCQYVGTVKQPAWGLRLALAYLFSVAGDDPGITPKSREPFDRLWRLVTGIESMGGGIGMERMRSTLGHTEYARIRRMVRVPQSIAIDAAISELRQKHRR